MRRRTKILGSVLLVLIAGVSALAIAVSHNSPCVAAPPLQTGAASMKAVVYRCYGPPEVAKLETVTKPVPGTNDILVKVRAASVNPLDSHLLRGEPYLIRALTGWGVPTDTQLQGDFAGTVEAVGTNVRRFKPGDRVFGGAGGAFADYVITSADAWVEQMPPSLSFEQAAAIPTAGLTALQALRNYGQVQPGQRVLVNGAAGGVGTFAVQIAKALGAEVTAVTSTANLDLVRSIGADHVIDYTREDFTRGTQLYDLIIDCGGGHSLLDFRRALRPHGRYVRVGEAHSGRWIEPIANLFIIPPLMSRLVSQQFIAFVSSASAADLRTLGDLTHSGKMRPVLDRRYPLSEMPQAIGYLETGHARGKVIITLD